MRPTLVSLSCNFVLPQDDDALIFIGTNKPTFFFLRELMYCPVVTDDTAD